MAEPVHYLAIGHLAKDLTPAGPRLGGTAAYSALTARALGYTPGLVTAHAGDLPLAPLEGMAVASAPSDVSTTFENHYGPAGRTQYLRARAAPLTATHVPAAWAQARVVHLAPIAREVDPALADLFAGRFVGLTPQGWMRVWDAEGRVRNGGWPEAEALLPRASAAVLSLEDVAGDWALAARWAQAAPVLVVTQGALGCTVFARGAPPRQVPAPPADEVDPTGAGDIFAAAFFVHLHETGDPVTSARFANQVAARSVTRPGLEGVPKPDEAALGRIRKQP